MEHDGKLDSDAFNVPPCYEYTCCGHRKELETWFFPEYLVCGNPVCRRKIKPTMIREPRQTEEYRQKVAREEKRDAERINRFTKLARPK
jgi:hypothetical protein